MMAKKEVMNWEEQMAAEAQAVAKTERMSTNRILLRSGIMTYMDQPVPDNTLVGIVVAYAKEHSYYTTAWDPDNVVPPDCFALGMPEDEMEAHESVKDSPGPVCDDCPMFQWPKGKKGPKPCGERRRLAIIPQTETPEEIAEADMAMMRIPVTSIRNWGNYVNALSASVQRPPWGVLTQIKVAPDPKSQFKVHFEAVQALDNDWLAQIVPRKEMARQMLLTPYDMAGSSEETADSDKY
jgi:hypothetical protein